MSGAHRRYRAVVKLRRSAGERDRSGPDRPHRQHRRPPPLFDHGQRRCDALRRRRRPRRIPVGRHPEDYGQARMAGPGATAGDDRTPALSQQGRSVSPYPIRCSPGPTRSSNSVTECPLLAQSGHRHSTLHDPSVKVRFRDAFEELAGTAQFVSRVTSSGPGYCWGLWVEGPGLRVCQIGSSAEGPGRYQYATPLSCPSNA